MEQAAGADYGESGRIDYGGGYTHVPNAKAGCCRPSIRLVITTSAEWTGDFRGCLR